MQIVQEKKNSPTLLMDTNESKSNQIKSILLKYNMVVMIVKKLSNINKVLSTLFKKCEALGLAFPHLVQYCLNNKQ